jgi:hypothetical protein
MDAYAFDTETPEALSAEELAHELATSTREIAHALPQED